MAKPESRQRNIRDLRQEYLADRWIISGWVSCRTRSGRMPRMYVHRGGIKLREAVRLSAPS